MSSIPANPRHFDDVIWHLNERSLKKCPKGTRIYFCRPISLIQIICHFIDSANVGSISSSIPTFYSSHISLFSLYIIIC